MSEAFIEFVEIMGGDLAVVGKTSGEMTERDERVVQRLLHDQNSAVFGQSVMTWYIRCPVFVAREWSIHQIGVFNETPERFKMPIFYTPKNFRRPESDGPNVNTSDGINDEARALVEAFYEHATRLYRYLGNPVEPTAQQHSKGIGAGLGIANEHARIVLPLGLFTEFRWTVNVWELMRFLVLYNRASASGEIRAYAKIIEHLWSLQMPVTHAAFAKINRATP